MATSGDPPAMKAQGHPADAVDAVPTAAKDGADDGAVAPSAGDPGSSMSICSGPFSGSSDDTHERRTISITFWRWGHKRARGGKGQGEGGARGETMTTVTQNRGMLSTFNLLIMLLSSKLRCFFCFFLRDVTLPKCQAHHWFYLNDFTKKIVLLTNQKSLYLQNEQLTNCCVTNNRCSMLVVLAKWCNS